MQVKAKKLSGRLPLVETLESRQLLSAAANVHLALSSNPDDIGNTETLTATVTAANAGSGVTPSGSVRFLEGTTVLGKVALTDGVATYSTDSFFTGSYPISAKYLGDANFAVTLSNTKTLNVVKGTVQSESLTGSNGTATLQYETFGTGTGPAVVNDDGVEINYYGYLASNGTLFDSSIKDGSPFSTMAGGTGAIPGFADGVIGLEQGQTRVLFIPPALGYSTAGQGSIPGNARLVFIISLAAPPTLPELGVAGANSETITNNEAPNSSDGTLFENVSVGSTSGPLSITLSNASSTAGLSFTKDPGIVDAGADPGDFTVGSFASGVFKITFAPTETGLRTAKIKIFTDDATNPTFVINVQGTGL